MDVRGTVKTERKRHPSLSWKEVALLGCPIPLVTATGLTSRFAVSAVPLCRRRQSQRAHGAAQCWDAARTSSTATLLQCW